MNARYEELDRFRLAVITQLAVAALVIGVLSCSSLGTPLQVLDAWRSTATPTPSQTPSVTPTASATPSPTPTPEPTRTRVPRIEVLPNQLVYVKHESVSRGRGLPDTYQYYDFKFVKAPPGSALREYIRQVQRLAVPGMPEEQFEDQMSGFWAGNRALNNGHDYNEDFAVGPVITGGAMARATGNVRYRSNRALVEIYAIDPENLPALPASIEGLDWTLHFRPTIVSQTVRPDGRWRINPFPFFDGWGIAPILGGGGRQWIDAAILVPIDAPLSPFEYPELQAWPTASPN